jgi:hypothetical protein
MLRHIDKNNRNTDRLRPDDRLGGCELGLSLPQHAPSNDVKAVQKHHVTPVIAHVIRVAFEI